ncbi:uncharacterized protein LOC124189772 [Daphnia pulex]|uniref:uncharacterized protein LOC124189772 n=1 Tax=Daphnia pulex TaxID=6669 RepID=UPI001EE0D85E|nr:uncharacterized protein LOC124189772 [Daphnia pulex]
MSDSDMEINPARRMGFADDNFVMIHGDYYRMNDISNANRRPIMLLAWYTEFADILLRNLRLGLAEETRQDLEEKGATDIVKKIAEFLENTPSVFSRPGQSTSEETRNRNRIVNKLKMVKQIRNHGTHNKIQDSYWLEAMLTCMIDLCQMLKQLGMASNRLRIFEADCVEQLKKLRRFNDLF